MSKPGIEGGSTAIAVSGLQAQKKRIQLLAENIANANSTARTAGGEPYRRQIPVFKVEELGDGKGVALSGVRLDPKPFPQAYDPGHPGANAAGYVLLPNVNSLAESLDLKQAMRAYEANLNVLENQDAMDASTLSILKK
ncbi:MULTISPECIES: flagellar basal body rod protein FlgC [unclassified Caulobacter]|jgi:flagellar basal-body rod protein FlgC|uniref:flagellar basal body rod protein FlgC n=1 Tax=unclassified Caulobacter TaxID=2648921 RepID=UPI0015530908|nr:flagellar basal body rod protein FlgC [Caulobacter sp. RHG1]NQE65323.1 Flagellar basal-body rod protein FlgC [Caulobacter sp. RHG1]